MNLMMAEEVEGGSTYAQTALCPADQVTCQSHIREPPSRLGWVLEILNDGVEGDDKNWWVGGGECILLCEYRVKAWLGIRIQALVTGQSKEIKWNQKILF